MINKIIESDLEYIVTRNLPWSRFNNKTVLITGAAGFLPAYMVHTLLYLKEKFDINLKVIGLVRNMEKALARFNYAKNNNSLQLIEQDICNPINIQEKVDFIIHAASMATPKVFREDPVGTILPNVLGTNNLLKIAKDHQVENFLFFSTSGVYGYVDESFYPISENCFGALDSMDLASCYLESKRMGENLCVSWFHQYAVPINVVRPGITYGPGLDLTSGRSFEDFIAAIKDNRDLELFSDGLAVRNFCYISDAIYGFFLVMLKGKVGEAYNVATDHEISIRDLANLLVKNVFPEKNLKVIMKKNDSKNYMRMNFSKTTVDINKIKELGWEIRTAIPEGFKRVVSNIENIH